MKKLIFILGSVLIISGCGPSQEEREKVAAVTCSIMSETRNMDAAVRVEKMNDARDKIGGETFLSGDDEIQVAFKWGLCQELVLNETYHETLQSLKDARLERVRLASERQAAEKQRIANIKPTIKDEFYSNGQLKSRTSHKEGLKEGVFENYYEDGSVWSITTYKGDLQDGLYKAWASWGEVIINRCYKEGEMTVMSYCEK
ncbi:hypothetical protein N9D45_05645 [Gammaproteobacteria bacterium]|nr:hypothetical protein [Gammaproteobacteria bacterium]